MPETPGFLKSVYIRCPYCSRAFVGQNAELKKDLSDTLQCQDDNTRKRGAAHHRERIPQKRRRIQQSSDDEYEDPSYYPCERVVIANLSVGVSRGQIQDVLGGCDRGWGSMQYVYLSPLRISILAEISVEGA